MGRPSASEVRQGVVLLGFRVVRYPIAIPRARPDDQFDAHPTVWYDIWTAQELLGHKDVRTSMIYTPVLNRGGRGVYSPLDRMRKPVGNDPSPLGRAERRPNTGS